MAAAVISACTTVVVAALVFALNQYAQMRAERRQARLLRVNTQLRELYGPLYVLVDVNECIYQGLMAAGLPGRGDRTKDTLAVGWTKWLDHALFPANVKMRDLILSNGDLLREEAMPDELRMFCAHVSYAEVSRAAGTQGAEADGAYIGHPGDVYPAYVRGAYAALKREQQELLTADERESRFRLRHRPRHRPPRA
ncbi:hypothetical protein [Streptomyces phytophilus]|uniref:hypothetical protein n=1 Tax=Streptomyces phytophilus TaxID=722715 RepID=UPI0015EFF3D4|nr:hypothetical protein [Streptomyces phytophilus]